MQQYVLAADLGGTNLRTALVAVDGKIVHRVKRPTPKDGGPNAIVQALAASVRECVSAASDTAVPTALAVAVAATVNIADGILRNAPNLPFLDGFKLSEALSKEVGMPAIVDNDATLAAVGEHWLGASRGVQNAICVTLGTGVGGGLILGGHAYRGVDGSAGEIGHICVEPDGFPCGCGSNGCIEQYASATALVRMVRERSHLFPESKLNRTDAVTSRQVFEAGLGGDALAIEAFRMSGRYLGIALAGLVNVLNPEIIVIGGGMAGAFKLFIDPLADEIRKRAFREPAERARLVAAELGDDAGILGAARAALLSQTKTSGTIV